MTAPRGSGLPGLGRLWWGVAASPIAWVLAELVGYPMVARSCEPALGGAGMQGLAHPRVWMGGLTLLLTAVAASGVWVALMSVRATSNAVSNAPPPLPDAVTGDRGAPWGRARFMAIAGVFVSSIFLLGTVLNGLPSLIVNVCAQVR